MNELTVIGGGLAGSEATWQAAQRGVHVALYEMRPGMGTGAHVSDHLAELVCSNSLGSQLVDRASGLLHEELRRMGSLLIRIAAETSVPAGSALAVDRVAFASQVTRTLESHPLITIIREEVSELPESPTIVATGPLTSPRLSEAIAQFTGTDHLYFYDAISPIVSLDSIDFDVAFRGNRYGRGENEEGDYINCPMTADEYYAFVEALAAAGRIELKAFERELTRGVKAGRHAYFEGCLPVEIIARRGPDALAFGPLRPVGLRDPRTGARPYAVVQLRQDNLAATLYNLVGFQTNLKFPEQRRVFRMIPGLQNARFERYGQMHRNTFIFSPAVLNPALHCKTREDLFFAGQITGVEGYTGNIATGLFAGVNAARRVKGLDCLTLPATTMLGALIDYITHAAPADFQPMKANFGILPPLEPGQGKGRRGRRQRARLRAQRSLADLEAWLDQSPDAWPHRVSSLVDPT